MKTLEELSSQSAFSLEDVASMIDYFKIPWRDDDGNEYSHFTKSVYPNAGFPLGTEIPGLISGNEFEIQSGITVQTTEAVKGVFNALLYITSDDACVIFY